MPAASSLDTAPTVTRILPASSLRGWLPWHEGQTIDLVVAQYEERLILRRSFLSRLWTPVILDIRLRQ
jgi:hypothetical protein